MMKREQAEITGKELPKTLAGHLLEQLRWQIVIGDLKPGQSIREQHLEKEFGSSRGPVRESLRMLLQNGLVEYQRRRGFRVRNYTPKYVRDLYTLRANLEGLVMASLVDRDLAPLIDSLERSNDRMRAYFKIKDTQSYFAENQIFHETIISFTGNQPINEIMTYVNEVSLPVRYKFLKFTLLTRRSLDYHERIVDYLSNNQIDKARVETQEHILINKDQAAELYDEKNNDMSN